MNATIRRDGLNKMTKGKSRYNSPAATLKLDLSRPGAEELIRLMEKHGTAEIKRISKENKTVSVIVCKKEPTKKPKSGALQPIPFSLGKKNNQETSRQSSAVVIK